MKIQYLKHKDIDKALWDNCISNAPNRYIYALSWYLDITSPGWDALIYGNYEAVMPLTWRQKYGLKYLIQPYYSQQLGVFGQGINEKLVLEFLKRIPRKFLLVRINLNIGNTFDTHRQNALKKNYELYLNKNSEELFRAFSKTTKKNINHSKDKFFEYKKISDWKTALNFLFNFLDQRKLQFPKKHELILEQIISNCHNKKLLTICGVSDSNSPLASLTIFLHSFDRRILIASANSEEGRKYRAKYFLLNQFILENSESDLILDFEGSNIESIAHFNSGFGSKVRHYMHLSGYNLFLR